VLTSRVVLPPPSTIALPALLAGVVFACDTLLPHAQGIAAIAALDEPAHLATAALALLAAVPWERLSRTWSLHLVVLASAVLIDVDHVPLYLGLSSIAPGGRPVTHSLATPLLLLAASTMLRRRSGPAVAAAAVGICLHLVRDLATGPGVSLFWPLTTTSVLLPYPAYAATVGVLGTAATVRCVSSRSVRLPHCAR
jgi:inner membrane protein